MMEVLNRWKDALGGMPSLDHGAWNALDPISRWLISARAAVLVMTWGSCILAGLFAWGAGHFDLLRFSLVFIGLTAAHASNNILNDVTDHLRGVDRDDAFRTRYGTQPVEQGFMSPSQARLLAALTLAPGLLAGGALVWLVGNAVFPFFVAGVLLVFFYNWPLKHYGLGEPTVVAVWGPLMVGGGYVSITGTWSTTAALLSIPFALGPTTVLFGKHTDKIPWDKPRGVRTMPVLLGRHWARKVTLALIALQYLSLVLLVLWKPTLWPILMALAALPFIKHLGPVFGEDPPAEPPEHFPQEVWPLWYSAYAFVHGRRFGLFYVLGIAIWAYLP